MSLRFLSILGVVHHDDLQYILYMSFIFPLFKEGDPENVMVEKMTTMWTNFAKTGEPIPKNNNLLKGVTWSTLTPRGKEYLDINEKFTMQRNMFADRYGLWDRLFPLEPPSSVKC